MSNKPSATELAKVAIFDRGIGWQADATATLKEQAAEIDRLHKLVGSVRVAFNRECDDTDEILKTLGFAPENCRTDGGSLMLPELLGAIQHRDVMVRREANTEDKALLWHALEALIHHKDQTRPIQRTDVAIAALRLRLFGLPKETQA